VIAAPDGPSHPWQARVYRLLALALCALFLASVAGFYHPGLGFTALLGLPEGHEYEVPALRAMPHADTKAEASYDGQFYVQLALEPLLRDPAIDRAMDLPAYRARRILFSWTAYLAGFGRTAWVVNAYALQNVVCWLILAWLLTRWIPLTRPRHLAAWTASMFSHGLLWSVHFSLVDGPSLLLLACAVVAAERGRTWLLSAILGAGGLARETNLLGVSLFRVPRTRREWFRLALLLLVVAAPLLIWQDYLWSIYRTRSLVGRDQLGLPFVAYVGNWIDTLNGVRLQGAWSGPMLSLVVIVSLTVQAAFVLYARAIGDPWWRLAVAYAALMLVVHSVVWSGHPGAITRVVLPLTFGFNILLVRAERGFWIWFGAGNLHLIASLRAMPIPGLPPIV
jgi:hypothetical protein